MSVNNSKKPVVDPAVCRCCGSTKKCRLLNFEYEWQGQKEVYSEMFVDTFGLVLSQLEAEVEGRVICATCVLRLRDASAFRRQVLQCEERLLTSAIHVHGPDGASGIKQETDLKVETTETSSNQLPEVPDDVYMDADDRLRSDDDDNDSDNIALIKIETTKRASKKALKKEKNATKRAKLKTKSSKKETTNTKKEMLAKIKSMSDELEKMQEIAPPPETVEDKPTKPRVIDNQHMAFRNTVTIVESSYVCPFDTSFSDYFCIYCRQVYTDPNKLKDHTLTHDPVAFKDSVTKKNLPQLDISRIDCRLCPQQIDDMDNLKSHLTNVHGKVLYPVTNEFLKFRLTANHLTCTECNSQFGFFHALKKHMAEHFGSCICDVCGAHYFEERMLILHQKTHQRVDESYPCKDCGKTFKSKHSRYLHEARMHKKEPAYQCPKCDEVLFSYTLRYRHMIAAHGEERRFACGHCERAYDSRKSLREHTRRYHLKIFRHQCDLCDKRFYLPSRLKEHMATHTGERNYRCEYCGKSYPRLRGLKVHMQSHSSEKKYRCVLCNASFTQNVNLKNHVKRQHQGLEAGYHE